MRNHVLKKLSVFVLTAVMAIGGSSLSALAEVEGTESEENVSIEDDTAKAGDLLEDIKGTYEPLFPIITDSQYDQLWLDPCISVVGEEAAPEVAEMLKSACNGTVYGQEAIDAFGDGSEGAQFDCLFINGPSTITFDGSTISGTDENGDQLFSHEYTFVDGLSLAGLMDGYLYETEDEDAGEFRYFYMMPDTPATTYHLEFRYGSDVDALSQYNEGPYAYWLAAAFPVDADEEMVKNVITLFCEENLAEMQTEEAGFAGGSGTEEDPWQIATADQLNLVREDLGAHYILTDDIDLSGYDNWEPIGTFQSLSDAPEDAEIPHPDYAFTGTFDGNGHIISNLTVNCEAPMGAGLFGCAMGTEESAGFIRDFTLENANVSGFYLVGGAVGLQFMNCGVSGIELVGENTLTGMQGIGGIGGTGFDLISDCKATADIIVTGDDGACAGLIAGGTTMSSIAGCEAVDGSITAEGKSVWGIGAVCGAPWGAAEISNCKASGTSIKVSGEGNRLVGGLLGFAGSYEPEAPAQISGCIALDVDITVSDSTNCVGGLVGAGKEMMEGSDVMSAFEVKDCAVSGTITGGGSFVDPVVGDPACAVSVDCEGGMIIQ